MEWTPEKIKELRMKLKLSQQAFGTMTGVSREFINKLERGSKKPSKTLSILFGFIDNKKEAKHGENQRTL